MPLKCTHSVSLSRAQVAKAPFAPALVAIRWRMTLARVLFGMALLYSVLAFTGIGQADSAPSWLVGHPLTGLCLLLLAMGFREQTLFNSRTKFSLVLSALVLLLTALRLLEGANAGALWLSDVIAAPLRWSAQMRGASYMPPEPMPISVITSLLLLSASTILQRRAEFYAYILAVAALFVPSLTLVNVVVTFGEIPSDMSVFAALLLFGLCIVKVLAFVRAEFLRHMFGATQWGHFARRMLLVSILGVGAFAIITGVRIPGAALAIEIMTMASLWLFGLSLLILGPNIERNERQRRALERELHMQAKVDPLTGALNRRAAREYFEGNMRGSRDPFGVILLDIDHFKEVNDTAGHEAGDIVLGQVAAILCASLKAGDVVVRWGGEEFLILLPNATIQDAKAIAQTLRLAIANHISWSAAGCPTMPITASFGVSQYQPDTHKNLEDVLKKTDGALMAAKARGRNRVLTSQEPSAPSFIAVSTV